MVIDASDLAAELIEELDEFLMSDQAVERKNNVRGNTRRRSSMKIVYRVNERREKRRNKE